MNLRVLTTLMQQLLVESQHHDTLFLSMMGLRMYLKKSGHSPILL